MILLLLNALPIVANSIKLENEKLIDRLLQQKTSKVDDLTLAQAESDTEFLGAAMKMAGGLAGAAGGGGGDAGGGAAPPPE